MIGQDKKLQRWNECTQRVLNKVPQAVGALYVREHFNVTERKEAIDMVANLRESFSDMIMENGWMDEQTKKIAIEKVKLKIFIPGGHHQ
jgi:membrane metallo-endopeptidase-like protein 1